MNGPIRLGILIDLYALPGWAKQALEQILWLNSWSWLQLFVTYAPTSPLVMGPALETPVVFTCRTGSSPTAQTRCVYACGYHRDPENDSNDRIRSKSGNKERRIITFRAFSNTGCESRCLIAVKLLLSRRRDIGYFNTRNLAPSNKQWQLR